MFLSEPVILKAFLRLTYRRAVNWLREKLNLSPERIQEIRADQQEHGFTMAGIDSLQALARLNERVQAFINEGRTLEEFRRDFEQIATEEGLTYRGTAAWRSKLVALTNARNAYGAARYQQQTEPQMLRDRPYWQYRHGGSAEPRVLHVTRTPNGWNGLILPATSPWWNAHYPPNGYGCSCRVFSLSAADLDRRGLTVDTPPQNGFYSHRNRATGQVELVPMGVDPGFDHIPGRAPMAERQKLYREMLAKLPPELQRQGEEFLRGRRS